MNAGRMKKVPTRQSGYSFSQWVSEILHDGKVSVRRCTRTWECDGWWIGMRSLLPMPPLFDLHFVANDTFSVVLVDEIFWCDSNGWKLSNRLSWCWRCFLWRLLGLGLCLLARVSIAPVPILVLKLSVFSMKESCDCIGNSPKIINNFIDSRLNIVHPRHSIQGAVHASNVCSCAE